MPETGESVLLIQVRHGAALDKAVGYPEFAKCDRDSRFGKQFGHGGSEPVCHGVILERQHASGR